MSDLNIYQRINAVRDSIGVLGKDAQVQNYRALTHDKVTRAVSPLMVKHGLCSTVSVIDSKTVDCGVRSKSGRPLLQYQASYRCKLINVDNPGDCVEMIIDAHADDHGDKAPGKGISYATKTFFLKIFSIETGENDEARVNDDDYHAEDEPAMTEEKALSLCKMIDNANIETGEGVDEFGEAWIEMDAEEQKKFSPYFTNYYPGAVSATKQRMRDILTAYRERLNNEEAA